MYKKKDLLNEIAGVPKSIEDLVDAYYSVVIHNIDETLRVGCEIEYRESGLVGVEGEHEIAIVNCEYEGNEIMNMLSKATNFSEVNDFIKSNLFKTLPLWRPYMIIEATLVPLEYFESELNDGHRNTIGAAFRTHYLDTKLKTIGKMPIVTDTGFIFSPILPLTLNGHGLTDEYRGFLEKQLKPVIAHELLHAYQAFKQLEGGGEAHFGRETMLNAMTQNPNMKFDYYNDWNEFTRLVYLHLSFEINARVNELYYRMKGANVKTKEEFLHILKKSDTWKEVKALEEFDAKQFMRDFEIPEFNEDPISKIIGKSLYSMKAGKLGLEDVSNREETLKSIIKLWDYILQGGSYVMKEKHGIDIPMDEVPESAKKDPYLFFKFFEKRFHKKAKKFKRKLYKLASIVVDQEEPVKTESIKKKTY